MKNIRICTLCFLLALLYFLLLVGSPGPDASRFCFVRHSWDLGHVLCFALWTWLYLQWRPMPEFWRQFSTLVVLTLTLGGMIEVLQAQLPGSLGREGSWGDL